MGEESPSHERATDLERAMDRLDEYEVVRVLADKPGFTTEVVFRRGDPTRTPLVMKHVSTDITTVEVWQRLARAQSDHLPKVLDLIELPDEVCVLLQWVPGISLGEFIEEMGHLTPAQALHITDDLIDVLNALGAQGIVHRDIKPSNVILDGAHAWLIDPGIARIAKANQDHDTKVIGSWGFAAPEQLGFAETDQRSDVFSLGRLLGFMLTGVYPDEEAFTEVLARATRDIEPVASVIAEATALAPAERPVSAKALGLRLHGAWDHCHPPRAAQSPGIAEVPRTAKTPVPARAPRPSQPARPDQVPQSARPTILNRWLQQILPPHRTSRSARRRPRKGLAIAALVLTFFFGILFIAVGVSGQVRDTPFPVACAFGIAIALFGNILPGFEVAWAALLRPPYDGADDLWRLCLLRVLRWWAFCFATLFASYFIYRMAGGAA